MTSVKGTCLFDEAGRGTRSRAGGRSVWIVGILVAILGMTISSSLFAKTKEGVVSQGEVTAFGDLVLKSLKHVDAADLDAIISFGGKRSVIRIVTLVLDHGVLRRAEEGDSTSELNHGMTLLLEKNFSLGTLGISIFDDRNRKRLSYDLISGVRVVYAYDDAFLGGRLADSARAYVGRSLIARAEAVRVVGQVSPFRLEVRETQYCRRGDYHGRLLFELASFPKLIVETARGPKQVFTTWAVDPEYVAGSE